ncbi:MAG: radical SAM protein [Proteobacteria bacterium]|nr:radical SAM protein [Pseudomonadota bacterium]
MQKKICRNRQNEKLITALVANSKGEIFDLDGYAAVGMEGSFFQPLTIKDTVKLPYGSELMFLPDRKPVLFNIKKGMFETLHENPYIPGEIIYPVASFNSPGYMVTYNSAYQDVETKAPLPLFSYGAVGWDNDGFRSAVLLVDKEKRQDLRLMPREKVVSGVSRMQEKMPDNRLRSHLENCALVYGCPAAKNFFIGRFEAPLPTSRQCNARCMGCISLQKSGRISNCQDRISFTPTPDEIAEIALEHMKNVKNSVVSFGQGCEGDPLMAWEVILPAIKKIRQGNGQGTINMNTNGSRPDIVAMLFDEGLDSIRVSINSVRESCYQMYFRPTGYHFSDVLKTIEMGIHRKRFVSVNYLNCPGITDTPEEWDALLSFLDHYPIHMIQWRNLNYDPLRYRKAMEKADKQGVPIGMEKLVHRIKKWVPDLIHGYFNPPRENFLTSHA